MSKVISRIRETFLSDDENLKTTVAIAGALGGLVAGFYAGISLEHAIEPLQRHNAQDLAAAIGGLIGGGTGYTVVEVGLEHAENDKQQKTEL